MKLKFGIAVLSAAVLGALLFASIAGAELGIVAYFQPSSSAPPANFDPNTGEEFSVQGVQGSRVTVRSETGDFLRSFGYDAVATGPDDSAIDERQQLTVFGTGGYFTLGCCFLNGSPLSTTHLEHDATAQQVEEALDALVAIGPAGGNVTVTGGPAGPADPGPYVYTIEFGGALAGDDFQPLNVSTEHLLGNPAIGKITTTVEGGALETCVPADGDVCHEPEWTGYDGNVKPAQGSIGVFASLALAPSAAPNAGNVLVADPGFRRVGEYTASGGFLRAFGWDVVSQGPDDSSVNETQKVTVSATGGKFSLSFPDTPIFEGGFEAGPITGGIGTGNLTQGSTTVSNVLTSNGGFAAGQTITASAAGIPPGTTITGVDPGARTVTLSEAATANRTTIALTGNDIPYDASPAQVKAAVEALPSIGGVGGTVTVSGANGGPFTIEFGGALGGDELVALGSSNAGLSGGAKTATVTTLAAGGAFETCVQSAGDLCKQGVAGGGGVTGLRLGQFSAGGTLRLAEDEAGAIYVSDAQAPASGFQSSYRVQKFSPSGTGFAPSAFGSPDRQSITVSAGSGQFRLAYFQPEGTLGHGALHKGSTLVDGVTVDSGEFVIGQPIYEGRLPGSGTIPSGTTITGCSPSCAAPTSITISKPAPFNDPGPLNLHSTRAWQTADLEHDATHEQLEAALNALPPIAAEGGTVSVSGGIGDPGGLSPYLVSFDSPPLLGSDQAQLAGSDGTTPLGGGTGTGANQAVVATVQDGRPSGTSPDTSPADVATDGAGHVFVSKYFPAGFTTCPDGSPSPAETRIEQFATDGSFEGTSAACYGIQPGLNLGSPNPDLSVDPLSGRPYLRWASNLTTTSVFGNGDFAFVFGDLGAAPDLTLSTPSDIGPTGFRVSGEINPHGPLAAAGLPNPTNTTYRVQYRIEGESSWTEYAPPTAVGFGANPVPFGIGISGLTPKTTYEVRVLVAKLGRPDVIGSAQTVTTAPARPRIDGFSSSNVTLSSVDLHASVNPLGTDSTYHFEYGTTLGYGLQTPEVDIGSSQAPVSVQAHVDGLEPSVYHFRVVATNALGTTTSADQTFNFYPEPCPNLAVRQQTGAARLPDCRGYELVSPADAGTASLFSAGPNSPSAVSPSRLSFFGVVGAIPGPGNPPNLAGDLYVSTRTSTGWETHYVGIPADQRWQVSGPPNGGNLSGNIPNPIQADLTLSRILDWDHGQQGFASRIWGSMAPYMWDAEGNSLGRLPTNFAGVPDAAADMGAGGFNGDLLPSPDFSHYFFSSANIAFAPGGLTSGNGSVYDNDVATGTVTIVSKLPGGGDIPPEPGDHTDDYFTLPAASTDGSHVLLAAAGTGVCGKATCVPQSCGSVTCDPIAQVCGGNEWVSIGRCPDDLPAHLYMRVNDAVTYDVSKGHEVHYAGMSADGSKVYFTSAEGLTPGDDDESTDLYMWSEDSDALTRVSAGSSGVVGDTDACNASWIAHCGVEVVPSAGGTDFSAPTDNPIASKAGDVYFYSPEQFVGSKGVPGRRNLYVFRGGSLGYVATLDADKPLTRIQVAPDGAHAAFITATRLTGYDNAGRQEMYAFDAGDETLICVSCKPTGEPPTSDVLGSQNGIFMSDDGRTFFSTRDALVPEDSNGITDVYEYSGGRPQLISSGTADAEKSLIGEAGLVGVSGNGVDVYFATFKGLVAADRNAKFLRFYDARTGGGFPVGAEVAPCQAADECHGVSSALPAPPVVASTAGLGRRGNLHRRSVKRRKHRKKHHHPRNHRRQAAGPTHRAPKRGGRR